MKMTLNTEPERYKISAATLPSLTERHEFFDGIPMFDNAKIDHITVEKLIPGQPGLLYGWSDPEHKCNPIPLVTATVEQLDVTENVIRIRTKKSEFIILRTTKTE